MKTRAAARLAWSLCAGCIAGICGLVVLKALNGATDLWSMPVVVAPLAFAVVGALVASRQQRNPVGWQLLAVGVFMTANLAGESYARYALLTAPGSLPGGLYGAWLGWSYAPIVAILRSFCRCISRLAGCCRHDGDRCCGWVRGSWSWPWPVTPCGPDPTCWCQASIRCATP
jgi:hypothetical protein